MKSSVLMVISGLLLISGCGSSSKSVTPPPAISVSLTPSAQTDIDQGQTLNFKATVTNDSSNKGVSWTVSGTGCSGSACGTLTNGTATAVTYNAPATVSANMTVTVQATSASDTTKASSAPVLISPEPAITTTTLTNGSVGNTYSATLQATGGAGTLTWSLASGSSLPAGLSLSKAGVISGKPTAAGNIKFTVQVTDASSANEGDCSASQQLSLTIAPPPISVSLTPSAQTDIDQAQTLNFTATVANDAGNKGVTWAVSGTSCSGNACGTLSNTTTTAATYNAPASVLANLAVTVTATSVADTTKAASTPVAASPPPSITTTTLTGGAVGTAYSATLQASGGAGTLTWTLATGSSLPAGLSLNPEGMISGTPTAAGTSNFTMKVTDASQGQQGPLSATQSLTLTIAPAPLTITTTSLPNGVNGSAYSQTVQAFGGTPPYTWTVASGSTLPSWLSLSASGTLSGTPTATGTFSFSLTVTDSTKPTAQSKTQALSLTVVPVSGACGTGNESVMKGQYAFSLRGFDSGMFIGAVGSFTADGSGNITAGIVDTWPSSHSIIASSSTYSLGSDDRGCATIATSAYTFVTRFALDPSSHTVGIIEEWEPGGEPSPGTYIASGRILKQTTPMPASVPNGVWAFEEIGTQTIGGYGSFPWVRTTAVGTVTVQNGSYTGYGYSNTAGTRGYGSMSGTFGTPDPTTGRFTDSDGAVEYLVSPTQALEFSGPSINPQTTSAVGERRLQSGSPTLSGTLVYFASGLENSQTGGVAAFGLATASGSTLSFKTYEDDAGTWQTPSTSCGYTIDSNSIVTPTSWSCSINSSGKAAPIFALTGPNRGFFMTWDTTAMAGELYSQTAKTLTSSAGYFGNPEAVSQSQETDVGVATSTAGGVTGTDDLTSLSLPQQADQPLAETVTVNSDGTFSISDNPGVTSGVIISNSKIVLVGKQKHAYPAILTFSSN